MFAVDVRGRVVGALLKDDHPFPSYRHVGLVLDTSISPLSYRRLIFLVCLVSEMAYLAGLSPLAASISLSCSVSSSESELTDR